MIARYPFMKIIAGGRGKIGEVLGIEGFGFYGQCYDFAVAVNSIIGGRFVVNKPHGRVDHVMIEVDGYFIDANGIHPKEEWENEYHYPEFSLKRDVEKWTIPDDAKAIRCAFEMIGDPSFAKWKTCTGYEINERCPCIEKKNAMRGNGQ